MKRTIIRYCILTILLIIISVSVSVIFPDLIGLYKSFYPRYFDYYDEYYDNAYSVKAYDISSDRAVKIPCRFEYGISSEEFERLFPNRETETVEEYSFFVPKGDIIRVTDGYGNGDTIRKFVSKGKAPEIAHEDFKDNLMSDGEIILAEKDFETAQGQLCRITVTSEGTDDLSWSHEITVIKKCISARENAQKHDEISVIDRVFIKNDDENAFDDVTLELKAGDYDFDGFPDLCIKTGQEYSDGNFYVMLLKDDTRSHDNVYNRFNGFFVCGETDHSIRLNRIDRNTYYFPTKANDDGTGYIYAAYDNKGSRKDIEPYINNGMIFSSYYENGQLSLTCENTLTEDNAVLASFELKRLDGYVWKDTDISLKGSSIVLGKHEKRTFLFDEPLSQGLYKIIVAVDGKNTETEFRVI